MTNDEASIDDANLVGRIFHRRFRLDELISRGGSGEVYRGTDTNDDTPVAVKVVHTWRESMKEARLLNEVQHPHIVRVIDYGTHPGLAFLVMEYLEGEELEQLFRRQGCRLTTDQLRKFVREIGNALVVAHSKKLIHRDLKPRNIILEQDVNKAGLATGSSRFVLLDFGIAAKTDSEGTLANHTQKGAGTLEYMPPELLRSNPKTTEQSDIYAFGVMLYQMLTGQVPFAQDDLSHMVLSRCVSAIVNEPPRRFLDVDPDRDYSPLLEELVLECLEKSPSNRPQTMEEVCNRFFEITRSKVDTVASFSLETPNFTTNDERSLDSTLDLVGRELGYYRLDELIGRGGFGSVYRGTDLRDGTPVAVKVGLASSEFIEGARLTCEVQHPHIVKVIDYGSDRELAYIVMEYLGGEELEQLFRRQGCQLTTDQLHKFVREIGNALVVAHSKELIHRDLKPRNIILEQDVNKAGPTTGGSRFVLFDFGNPANFNFKGTLANEWQMGAGTVEFMAPELLSGGETTKQSDIYAFAVMLYQMITGQVPFPQVDSSQLALTQCVSAIVNEVPGRFSDVAPDRNYSSSVEELVLQCLEKSPSKRPQSVKEVCDRFFEIVNSQIDTVGPVSDTISIKLRPDLAESGGRLDFELPMSVTTLPPTVPIVETIPKPQSREQKDESLGIVIRLIDRFCKEHLNEEYAVLCRKLAEKLWCKRPSPLLQGSPNAWASGIVRAVGGVNLLHDEGQTPCMLPTDIDHYFGTSPNNGAAKLAAIRKIFKMHRFEPTWTLPSRFDDNPELWKLNVNGSEVDIREESTEVQEIAFKKGLIPYIPANRSQGGVSNGEEEIENAT